MNRYAPSISVDLSGRSFLTNTHGIKVPSAFLADYYARMVTTGRSNYRRPATAMLSIRGLQYNSDGQTEILALESAH